MIAFAVKEHYWNENYWILTFIEDQTLLRKLKAKHKSFQIPTNQISLFMTIWRKLT